MLIRSSFARNLSFKIALATSFLLFFILFVVTIIQAVITIENCATSLDGQLKLCAEKIDTEFDTVQKLGDNMAIMIDHVPADASSYRATMTKLMSTNPDILQIAAYLTPQIAYKSGLVMPFVSRTNDSIVFTPALQPKKTLEICTSMYENTVETCKTNPWYGPYLEERSGIYELSYLAASDGIRRGKGCIIETVVSMEWLVNSLESLKPSPSSEAYIINTEGKLICNSEHELFSPQKDSLENQLPTRGSIRYNELLAVQQQKDSTYVDIELDPNGKWHADVHEIESLQDWHKLRFLRKYTLSNGWTLCVASPLAEVFGDVKTSISVMLVGLLITIILLFFFCTRIIYKKARPLKQLTKTSQNIAQGDFDTALPKIKGNDEIKQLRDSFENMQLSLKRYVSDLKATTAENERMESELSIASNIQSQALRKSFPSNDKFELYAAMRAAKEVGGDLYDFVQKGDNLYICIGDVSGKGVPAALLMMTTTMMFRHLCSNSELPVQKMVSIINNCIADGNDSGFFVTLFVACIDLTTGEMQFCNGGHNEILIISADGKASFNKAKPNIACGLFEDFPFAGEALQLEKGSRIILYTDGVNEAMNRQDEEFGNDRLLKWACDTARFGDEKALVEDLLHGVTTFADGAQQSDDITILSLKLHQDRQ